MTTNHLHNLPAELTPFVGRAYALAELRRLLDESRLVTLTGPGGSGKTRLAIRVAQSLLGDFADGVWLADLSSTGDENDVPSRIATAVGAAGPPGTDARRALTAQLASRHLLLVLDNCEHLVDACATTVEELLTACPGVRILATSREPLHAAGETVWGVPPLALPDEHVSLPLNLLEQVDAVALFTDRARVRQSGFSLTPDNAPTVVEICRRLDGLPLAIELAAAQITAISLEQMTSLLDKMLPLLAGGRRSLPRQRTMEAALDWSHGLLTVAEQVLFRRLAVFRGTFDLAAAEAVAGQDSAGEGVVLPVLLKLIERSLVLADTRDKAARYRLLEPIRQYGAERLREAGEEARVRRAHALYYAALVEATEAGLFTSRRRECVGRFLVEQENVRAALGWAFPQTEQRDEAQGTAAIGLRLVGALFWFWFFSGSPAEGRRWTEAALEFSPVPVSPRDQAKALSAAGTLAWVLGDNVVARARLEESAALLREQPDNHRDLGHVLRTLAIAGQRLGAGEARPLLAEAETLLREAGDTWGLGLVLHAYGLLASGDGDYPEGRRYLEQALALFRSLADMEFTAETLNALGDLARVQDRAAEAEGLYQEALALLREHGLVMGVPSLLHNIGWAALRRGEAERAQRSFREGLALFRQRGDQRGIAESLSGLAGVFAAGDRPHEAAWLLGAAGAVLSASGTAIAAINAPDAERLTNRLRARLGEAAFDAGVLHGRGLTLNEALSCAASPGNEESTAGGPAIEASRLTAREREVVGLLVQGKTNRQIAEALYITEGTAALHVKHILAKLDCTSRTQVVAWALSIQRDT